MERRRDPTSDSALEREKVELAARLRPVCPDMSAEEFAALVERIAKVNLKFRSRPGDHALPLGWRSKG